VAAWTVAVTDPLPSPAPMGRIEAVVRGRVQGVGYRYFVMRVALGLGLVGWVANEADGSVRCVVEGPAEALDAFESELQDGPTGAIVDAVTAVRMDATAAFSRFEVRSGGHRGD
jgi:acylphosphatase